jgi:hypothetical protein
MNINLEDMARRLGELEDREAIRALIASYGPLADSGQSREIAALWTADGSYGVGGMGKAVGHEAIAGLIDGVTHRQLMADGCAHLLGPVAIDLDGDRAVARGHSAVFRHTATGFEVFRLSANRWELVRCDGKWRVQHRENALLDGSELAQALLSPPSVRHP